MGCMKAEDSIWETRGEAGPAPLACLLSPLFTGDTTGGCNHIHSACQPSGVMDFSLPALAWKMSRPKGHCGCEMGHSMMNSDWVVCPSLWPSKQICHWKEVEKRELGSLRPIATKHPIHSKWLALRKAVHECHGGNYRLLSTISEIISILVSVTDE